jgi:hypothetical protein
MYLGGRIITPKQLSSAVLLVFALAALAWFGYDALDGSITVCSRYGGGCGTRTYAGPGDYGYWLALGLYVGLAALLAWLAWRGLRERARDRYR